MPSSNEPPTRVAIAGQSLSLTAVILLLGWAELILAFLVFAVVRRQEPIWWLLTDIGIAIGCALLGQFAYGTRNWDRTTHLELRDGSVSFMPNRKMRSMGHETTKAVFPVGGVLEYHIETGDRYFTGDRDQFLRASLWTADSSGSKQHMLTDAVGVNPKMMATNLVAAGIPFRMIKIYDGQTGDHEESDVTARYTQTRENVAKRTVFGIFVGTTNLLLGVSSALIFHEVLPVVAIGVVGCFLIALATGYSKRSKRTALVQVATIFPLYAAGYTLAVIAVRFIFQR